MFVGDSRVRALPWTGLARSRSTAVDDLWRAATLAAPRGKLSVGGAIRSTRPGDRLRLGGPGLVRKGGGILTMAILTVAILTMAILTRSPSPHFA